jgi:hypothetical protein
MAARLRVYLTAEENRLLLELRKLTALPQRVRDRAEVIRLSHQGAYVENLAEFLDWTTQTALASRSLAGVSAICSSKAK